MKGWSPMSLDKRVTALENDVALRYDEISHNATMLLGMTTGMQGDIRTLKEDMSTVKEDIGVIQGDLMLFRAEVNRRFTSIEGKLEQVLQLLTNRP